MNPHDTEFDVIVLGAGGAGMAAALFAAIEGMKVLLVERTRWVGGTTALAAGAIWVPNTHLAEGSGDTPAKAAHYLQLAAPNGRGDLRQRFLELGPAAVKLLEAHSEVRMRAFPHHPDYLTELEDATLWGRVLECPPFDGRQLGADFALVRPPIPEFTVLGGMMVDRTDIGHLLNLTRSRASFAHATRLLLRHACDRMRYRRGARLVMGNALVGRLLASLRQRGVPVWTETTVLGLGEHAGRVDGVKVLRGGQTLRLGARQGVVLAGGGFNDHPGLRARFIPEAVKHSPRAGTSPGELIQQALALGARLSQPEGSAAFWAPVSVRRRDDGSTAVFPHFVLDRAKPGTVVVDASGRRFLNESVSYHQFVERMLRHGAGDVWLVADHRALAKYGLGMVRPGGRGVAPFLRDGYLVRAPTLEALAQRLAMEASTLRATVERINGFATTGIDEDFQRGTTAYQRNLGDAGIVPNPTLGVIREAPFYAVRLEPGDIGASAGLVTDVDARVLRGNAAIPGLYAAGNDMQSVMGGSYPGPGINLGPAIVFAFAAAQALKRDASSRVSFTAATEPHLNPGDKP
jgi:glycine/D-amino acid oxidase-like deaminating enzyme